MNNLKCTIGMLVISLLFFGCASSSTGSAKGKERHFEKDGGFAVYLPESWEVAEWPGLDYKILMGPVEGDFRLNMNFIDEAFNGKLDVYVEANLELMQETFDEFELIQRDEFVTLKGLKCERLVTTVLQNERYIRLIFYFFPGKNGKQLFATCGAPMEAEDAYDALFDEIIETFEWTKK